MLYINMNDVIIIKIKNNFFKYFIFITTLKIIIHHNDKENYSKIVFLLGFTFFLYTITLPLLSQVASSISS